MNNNWLSPVSLRESDKLIEQIAIEVHKRKLNSVTVLFLEMHKPIAYPLTHLMMFFSPLVIPFVGLEKLNQFLHVMGDRQNLEKLIVKLEDYPGK